MTTYDRPHFSDQKLTPLQAIRKYCIDCYCGQSSLIKECSDIDCPLYRYRMGHNPTRKGLGGNVGHMTGMRETLAQQPKSDPGTPSGDT